MLKIYMSLIDDLDLSVCVLKQLRDIVEIFSKNTSLITRPAVMGYGNGKLFPLDLLVLATCNFCILACSIALN